MAEREERIWKRFIDLLSLDTFGEREVISEGKRQKVLLGSVEYHHKIFKQAVQQIDVEDAIQK